MSRKPYVVRNTRNREVSIGDLPQAPAVRPHGIVNLLNYHSKTEIEQSENLVTLLQSGWLTMKKDGENKPASSASKVTTIVELDELDDRISSLRAELLELINSEDDHYSVTLGRASPAASY